MSTFVTGIVLYWIGAGLDVWTTKTGLLNRRGFMERFKWTRWFMDKFGVRTWAITIKSVVFILAMFLPMIFSNYIGLEPVRNWFLIGFGALQIVVAYFNWRKVKR